MNSRALRRAHGKVRKRPSKRKKRIFEGVDLGKAIPLQEFLDKYGNEYAWDYSDEELTEEQREAFRKDTVNGKEESDGRL